MDTTLQARPDLSGYENVAREMIRHEDEVINNRVGWMATLNGLLFTAVGFLWDKPSSRGVIFWLCVVGFVITLCAAVALHGATKAMSRIRKWWDARVAAEWPNYDGPGIIGLIAPGGGRFDFMADWFGPWDAMSWILLVGWIAVAYINFF
jgi:hypothetical protein